MRAEDGIRGVERSRGRGEEYKRQEGNRRLIKETIDGIGKA